ncbi:MAG: hypothetical protein ACH346_02310 [Chthoniobacterales bacterium]
MKQKKASPKKSVKAVKKTVAKALPAVSKKEVKKTVLKKETKKAILKKEVAKTVPKKVTAKQIKTPSKPIEDTLAKEALKLVDKASTLLRSGIKNSHKTTTSARQRTHKEAHALLGKATRHLDDALKTSPPVKIS